MKKPVIVVGYHGNMGRRYTAILDYLKHPWFGIENMGVHYDKQMGEFVSGLHATAYHSLIIATPTYTHMDMIRKYKALNLPMLVEKPVSKNLDDIEYIVNNKLPVTMVNQYKYLSGTGGATYYDYYNTGHDGIEWDCINIIGLARQVRAYVCNKSPIWKCCINGKKLELNDVNQGYVTMIEEWLENQEPDFDYLMESHKRSKDGIFEEGTYRNPSEDNKRETAGKSSNADSEKADASAGGERMHEERSVRGRQKRIKGASRYPDSEG